MGASDKEILTSRVIDRSLRPLFPKGKIRKRERQTDKQKDRETERQKVRQTDWQTNRQRDRKTYTQTDRQTDRQISHTTFYQR